MHSIFRKYTRHTGLDILKRVPSEVVNLILEILSPEDQICFALSCKTLYDLFLAFLREQSTYPFQLYPLGKCLALYRNTDVQPRREFLRRLENNGRWRYCSGCWKLHRQSAWSFPLSRNQLLFHKPYCMPYAGKVDLCPCLTISFPDMDHLIGTIKIAKQGYARTWYYDGLVENDDRVRGTLRHDCIFDDHPSAKLRVTTVLDWEYERERLVVKSEYEFELELQAFSQRSLSFIGIKTSLSYSCKNATAWLRRFFSEAGSTFSGWHKSALVDASLSHCLEMGQNENARILTLAVRRELGSGKWPDIIWMLHSHR